MHYRHNYRHNQLDHIYRTCISFLHELTEVVDGLPKQMVPGGGASQLHTLNSSIMDLGLENFWAKEG